MTVYSILRREGLNNPLKKPRIKRTCKRWQRRRPNSLWQFDLKQVDAEWLITILDDHSGFVTGSEFFKEGTARAVFLRPAELTTPFVVTPTALGWFDVDLSGLNIVVTGDFYLSIEFMFHLRPYIGGDATPPIDGRSWCYYGSIRQWVQASADYMIRAVVSDGIRRGDFVIWRTSSGRWHILKSLGGYTSSSSLQWGVSGDVPLLGDFDGDGRSDLVVWRNGWWFIRRSAGGSYTGFSAMHCGLSGDTPLVADFDGDGKADVGVWRPTG
jgi:hypothetical protein